MAVLRSKGSSARQSRWKRTSLPTATRSFPACFIAAHTDEEWRQAPLLELGNDRWRGVFHVDRIGRHEYTLEAGADHFRTWTRDLKRRLEAQQLTREAACRRAGSDRIGCRPARLRPGENCGETLLIRSLSPPRLGRSKPRRGPAAPAVALPALI